MARQCNKCGYYPENSSLHSCEHRLRMRNTDEGKLLWYFGYDYYDTESSARKVAEDCVELLKANNLTVNEAIRRAQHD